MCMPMMCEAQGLASCFTLPLELVIRFEHVLHIPTSYFHFLSIARDFIQCSVNLFFCVVAGLPNTGRVDHFD